MGPSPCVSHLTDLFSDVFVLSALEGDNLNLELVVELPQCLLFMNDILAIENHLLMITI